MQQLEWITVAIVAAVTAGIWLAVAANMVASALRDIAEQLEQLNKTLKGREPER
jgi:ABC-type Fe3+ transport system permease subunit